MGTLVHVKPGSHARAAARKQHTACAHAFSYRVASLQGGRRVSFGARAHSLFPDLQFPHAPRVACLPPFGPPSCNAALFAPHVYSVLGDMGTWTWAHGHRQ